MYAIAACNETGHQLQTGRILLRPGAKRMYLQAAARLIRLAVNLKVGELLQYRSHALQSGLCFLLHLEWITRLPILFGETPNAIE
jgi:hypothetical protein